MKVRISFLFVLLAVFSFGQTKGKITYSMTFSSDNPDMAMVSSMMQGSTMTLSFMPKKSKIEMKMGMLGSMTTVTDAKKKKVVLLIDMMGQKNASEDKIDDKKADTASAMKVVLVNETKTILGYNCKKALITSEDGKELVFWYTEDIKADLSGQKQFSSNIPGVVLEFSSATGDMIVQFVATNVSEEVSKKDFSMEIPEGYTIKSPEEMKMFGQ